MAKKKAVAKPAKKAPKRATGGGKATYKEPGRPGTTTNADYDNASEG